MHVFIQSMVPYPSNAIIADCEFNICENGGTCTDLIGTFSCNCAPGFTGQTCTTNINECQSNPCKNGGTCTDEINDFYCVCLDGFTGATCATEMKVSTKPCDCLNDPACKNCKLFGNSGAASTSITIRAHWAVYVFIMTSSCLLQLLT